MFIDHTLPNSLSSSGGERCFSRFTETSAYFAPSELGVLGFGYRAYKHSAPYGAKGRHQPRCDAVVNRFTFNTEVRRTQSHVL
jgi:hypothetical protein